VAAGLHDDQFSVDIFQTGSGTASNMNANEAIARRAAVRAGCPVHPNDHVNAGQSSNDVIPTAIHPSAACQLQAGSSIMPGKVNPVIPEAKLRRLLDPTVLAGLLTPGHGAS
jgi:fumarate hydratase class II